MPHSPRPRALLTETLTAGDVRLAYPLMREALPGLTLKVWLAYARRATACKAGTRGILVVRREGLAPMLGAVCYERQLDVRLGPVLRAEHFVAVDLLYPRSVLASLVLGLRSVAERLRCSAVLCLIPANRPDLARDVSAGQA